MTINKSLPLQENTTDCGVFCSQFLKFEYFDVSIPKWTATDIEKLRQMMVLELYENTLRWYTMS
jgi:Ulp1 family protease